MVRSLSIILKRGESSFILKYFIELQGSTWISSINNNLEFDSIWESAFEGNENNFALQLGDFIFLPDKYSLKPSGVRRGKTDTFYLSQFEKNISEIRSLNTRSPVVLNIIPRGKLIIAKKLILTILFR